MIEGHSYIITTGLSRFQSREVIRVSNYAKQQSTPKANRSFVPFSGFDGQSLAGSGALVFEGELLEVKN